MALLCTGSTTLLGAAIVRRLVLQHRHRQVGNLGTLTALRWVLSLLRLQDAGIIAPEAAVRAHMASRFKPTSFEEYWRASKAWQSHGLTLASARALTNAGFLKVEDLQSASSLELAMIPRIGAKSLALLSELKGEKALDVVRVWAKAGRLRRAAI